MGPDEIWERREFLWMISYWSCWSNKRDLLSTRIFASSHGVLRHYVQSPSLGVSLLHQTYFWAIWLLNQKAQTFRGELWERRCLTVKLWSQFLSWGRMDSFTVRFSSQKERLHAGGGTGNLYSSGLSSKSRALKQPRHPSQESGESPPGGA